MMKKLPVPENIPLQREIWHGFGKEELVRSCIVTSVVLVLTICICLIGNVREPVVVIAGVTTLTVFLSINFFSRLDQNQSIYEYLVRLRRFRTEQQTFHFKHKKEVIHFVAEDET